MKKMRLGLVFAAAGLMFLASCGETSSKGNWNQADKDLANDAVEEVRADMEAILGDKTDDFVNCYLEKVEDNYDNFTEADSDLSGCENLAKECATEMM